MNSINKTARIAGLLYLLFIPLTFFGFPYGLSHLFVPGDAARTANNITAAESLFRLSIVINLLGAILNVFVVLALYMLLKPVNKNMAALMVVFILLSTPIGMLNELNHVAVLLLLSGANHFTPFTASQLQALVPLFHELHQYGLSIDSGFLPRILGILLMIGCFGWLSEFFTAFFLPNDEVKIAMFTAWGEVLFPLWLLVKGVNAKQWEKRALESA